MDSLPARPTTIRPTQTNSPAKLPLTGITAVDFTNVVAGPSSSRMVVKLGATVYKIDPTEPQHSPTIMVTWAGEFGVGKKRIILNPRSTDGRAIIKQLVGKADVVVANLLDSQLDRLGLNAESLHSLNPSAIGLQISALRGEKRAPFSLPSFETPGNQLQRHRGSRIAASDCRMSSA